MNYGKCNSYQLSHQELVPSSVSSSAHRGYEIYYCPPGQCRCVGPQHFPLLSPQQGYGSSSYCQQPLPYNSTFADNQVLTCHRIPPTATVSTNEGTKPQSFFFTQGIPPTHLLPNVPSVSLEPPVQQSSIPFGQQQSSVLQIDENGEPIYYVNIPVPTVNDKGYLISLPVPASEFALIPQNLQQSLFQQIQALDARINSISNSTTVNSDSSGGEGEPVEDGQQKVQELRLSGSFNKGDVSSSNESSTQSSPQGYFCKLCVSNKETLAFSSSHVLHDEDGIVRCPILRSHVCKTCNATGDNAHTNKYCPIRKGLLREPSDSEEEERSSRSKTRWVPLTVIHNNLLGASIGHASRKY